MRTTFGSPPDGHPPTGSYISAAAVSYAVEHMSLPRPTWLFDREDDWADLARFVAANASRLGVVWGPRRAGKSTLVAALADAAGGLYYEAVRQDPALSRDELGRVLAARRGLPNVRFDTWDEVIHTLVSQVDHPVTVLDEFGYLREASPELPSVIQRVIDGTRRTGTPRSRLILCGSAVARLSHLLDRDNPLFGRAQLALVVDAFDFRAAANYWDIARWPPLAVAVHAIVGGLPGYRDIVGEAPSSPAGFDDWVRDSILASSSPLLEEDSLVLPTRFCRSTMA